MSNIQPGVDYMIVNYNSGLAWAVAGANPNEGASVVQWGWAIKPTEYNQRWQLQSVEGGWRIFSKTAIQ